MPIVYSRNYEHVLSLISTTVFPSSFVIHCAIFPSSCRNFYEANPALSRCLRPRPLAKIGANRAASDETTALAQLQALWEQAGLQEVETCAFTVAQRYPDFAVYWQALADSASIGARFAALSADMQAAVRAALQKRLPAAPDGSILVTARAHAAKGIRA